jgi:hypothetical protein
MDECTHVAHFHCCCEEQGKHWPASAEQRCGRDYPQALQRRQQRALERRNAPLLWLLRLAKPWRSLVLLTAPSTKQQPQTDYQRTRQQYPDSRFLQLQVSLAVAL